jgi:hypothetical protein
MTRELNCAEYHVLSFLMNNATGMWTAAEIYDHVKDFASQRQVHNIVEDDRVSVLDWDTAKCPGAMPMYRIKTYMTAEVVKLLADYSDSRRACIESMGGDGLPYVPRHGRSIRQPEDKQSKDRIHLVADSVAEEVAHDVSANPYGEDWYPTLDLPPWVTDTT